MPMPTKRNPVLWDFDLLRRLYEDELLTVEEIGVRLGVSGKVANKACRRAGVRMRRRGPLSGKGHPCWKGGVTTDKSGYVLRYKPNHPFCNAGGYIREHRLVMEQKLGRTLLPLEVVHHRDDDPSNNHPDNLELFASNREHLAATLKGKCPQWSEEGKARIAVAVRRPRKPTLRTKALDEQESSESSGRSTA
jgi:hypothetical protein